MSKHQKHMANTARSKLMTQEPGTVWPLTERAIIFSQENAAAFLLVWVTLDTVDGDGLMGVGKEKDLCQHVPTSRGYELQVTSRGNNGQRTRG